MMEKKYYISCKKDGSEVVYDNPERLLCEAYKYFAWCDNTPLYKTDVLKSGKDAGSFLEIPVLRPYTITGLCIYCGISEKTFRNYGNDEVFRPACDHLKAVIKQNLLEGAFTGAYSSAVVMRFIEAGAEESEREVSDSLVINVTSPEAHDSLLRFKESLSKK